MRNEKSLQKYWIHKKFKRSAFFISEKTAQKMDKVSTFYFIFKHFSIAMLGILLFCNILHLEMDF